MAKSKLSESEQVTELISNLDSGVKEIVQTIRTMILATSEEIGEQVKWNSASFYYTGAMEAFDPKEYKRDIVVCNLHRGKILLVFPTGAKVKDKLQGKDYPDGRKIITLIDLADVVAKEKDIQQVIIDWLSLIV